MQLSHLHLPGPYSTIVDFDVEDSSGHGGVDDFTNKTCKPVESRTEQANLTSRVH